MWPFRKRVFQRLSSNEDYAGAVRSLVLGSFTSSDHIKGQLESIMMSGRVSQVMSGEKAPDEAERLYLRAIGELSAKPAFAVPAMCYILLNVTGPDKIWAHMILGAIGRRAVPGICTELRIASGRMRTHLVGALEKLGDAAAVPTLEQIGKEEGEVGDAARKALENMRIGGSG